MNTNKVVLRAAIATVLGLTSSYSMAAYLEIGDPVKLATEIKVSDGDTLVYPNGSGFTIDMSAAAGRAISDTSPLELRLTLTNGAKFSTTDMTSLGCDYSAAAVTLAANNLAAISKLNGAAGDTTVTFKLKDGNIAASVTPKCTVSGLQIRLYGGQQAYTMIATAYLKSPAEPVTINTSGPIIDFKQAFGATVDTKTVTIDVTSPSLSQKFAGGNTVAELGLVAYTAITPTVRLDGVALGRINAITTLKVTLSGTPLSLSNGQVLAVTGTDGYGCTAAAAALPNMVVSTAAASGVTFSFGEASALNGIRLCLQTSGTTRLEKGKVSIELGSTSPTNSTPNITITNPVLTTFVKNGASIKVLNVPNPTATDKTFIRIYNMSSSKSSVYGTLYETAAAGATSAKELGKGKLLAEIDAGAVKILDAAAISTIFGVATWTGRAWMQIEGDSQQIRVQSLVRSGGAGGTLINLSDRVLEDSGKLCRSDTTCK